jgi:hypothetical protein
VEGISGDTFHPSRTWKVFLATPVDRPLAERNLTDAMALTAAAACHPLFK